jgi:hypothetical protein
MIHHRVARSGSALGRTMASFTSLRSRTVTIGAP